MDVFLIYKWWCVWHPPEVWVNPSGPYKWSLNADYQSERWLWFLASMSVGRYFGIKLNDGCYWHLNVVSLTCAWVVTQLLQSRWVMTTNLTIFDLWLECMTSIWVWLVSSISERCGCLSSVQLITEFLPSMTGDWDGGFLGVNQSNVCIIVIHLTVGCILYICLSISYFGGPSEWW